MKADSYVPIGEPLNFGVVRELVKMANGERSICIGFQDKFGAIELMPHHSTSRTYDHGESLVLFRRKLVMASDSPKSPRSPRNS